MGGEAHLSNGRSVHLNYYLIVRSFYFEIHKIVINKGVLTGSLLGAVHSFFARSRICGGAWTGVVRAGAFKPDILVCW